MKTLTQAQPSTGTPTEMVKHVVPKKEDGTLKDKALCGYLWDRLLAQDLPHGAATCKKCLKELR